MGAKAEAVRAELREARINTDRLKVQHVRAEAVLVERIDRLEQENEALRQMVQTISHGGKGAVL